MAGRSDSLSGWAVFLLILVALWTPVSSADQPGAAPGPGFAADFLDQLHRYRDNVDFRFRDRILSPLPAAERKSFQGLDYYEPVPQLALTALFERAGDRSVFAMPTYDRRTLRYSHYGTLTTSLDSAEVRLKAFRREEEGGARNILLVPFRDATNGSETYAGGRYLELSLPLREPTVLDFNRAMNPLCAYDPSYACPIPPPENRLTVPIRAGEKRYPAASFDAATGAATDPATDS